MSSLRRWPRKKEVPLLSLRSKVADGDTREDYTDGDATEDILTQIDQKFNTAAAMKRAIGASSVLF